MFGITRQTDKADIFPPFPRQSVIKLGSNIQQTLKSYMPPLHIYFINMDWIKICSQKGK